MQKAELLIRMIEEAFSGVVLGDGVGLWQAQGLDDYCDEKQCMALREKDEKLDWRKISKEDINRCYSSLSFFDAAGMRFHLPAYMILDIEGGYDYDLDLNLTDINDYKEQQFSLLNQEQRQAVRSYLSYRLDQFYQEFDKSGFEDFSLHNIERALAGYWQK